MPGIIFQPFFSYSVFFHIKFFCPLFFNGSSRFCRSCGVANVSSEGRAPACVRSFFLFYARPRPCVYTRAGIDENLRELHAQPEQNEIMFPKGELVATWAPAVSSPFPLGAAARRTGFYPARCWRLVSAAIRRPGPSGGWPPLCAALRAFLCRAAAPRVRALRAFLCRAPIPQPSACSSPRPR